MISPVFPFRVAGNISVRNDQQEAGHRLFFHEAMALAMGQQQVCKRDLP